MLRRINATPALLLLLFGVLVTALVSQLRPPQTLSPSDNTSEFSQPVILFNQQPNTTVSTEETSTIRLRPTNETPLDPIAHTLNDLMNDYFTTSFGQITQDKWAYELSVGSPFLGELAAYLKIDKLYGIDLHLEKHQSLNASVTIPSQSNDTKDSPVTLFTYIDAHGKNFWPMSIIASASNSSQSPRLLLNHYDRDFVLKIESQELSAAVAPLAPGIERLLRYHLSESVKRSSGLRTRRYTTNIDQTVEAFRQHHDANHLFEFYNLVIKRDWPAAALFLKQSEALNTETYFFLYDLMAIHSADALLDVLDYTQYALRQDWWDQFLFYQLCIVHNPDRVNELNQRASIQVACQAPSHHTVPKLFEQTLSDELFNYFWDAILNDSELTVQKIEDRLQTLSASDINQLDGISSHAMLDFLARRGRLKIIRNARVFQRIEMNFSLWQTTRALPTTDSFYQYNSLHAWFNQRRAPLQKAVQLELPNLIPQLSPAIIKTMAQDLTKQVEKAIIQPQLAPVFVPMVADLSLEDAFLLTQFAQLRPEFDWPITVDAEALSETTRKRLKEASFELLLSWEVHALLDTATDFDGFAQAAELTLRNFQAMHSESPMAAELSEGFDDFGQLTPFALRSLIRIWRSAYPDQEITSDQYTLP